MKRMKRVGWAGLLVNLLWWAVICYLTSKMRYINDDLRYTKSLLTGEEITGVGQLIPSAVYFWKAWSGRFLPLLVIQALLMLPKAVFNMLNATVYVIVINTIASFGDFFYSDREKKGCRRLVNLSILYFIGWFFMPAMSSVLFWMTGAVAYLWTACAVLLFLRLFSPAFARLAGWKNTPDGRDSRVSYSRRILRAAGYILLGFAAGFSNEVPSCTLIVLFAAYIFFSYRKKKHIPVHEWGGMISMVSGTCLLMLAPGNFVRSSYVSGTTATISLLTDYTWRIGRETYYAARYLMIPLAIGVFLFLLANKREEDTGAGSLWTRPEVCLCITAFVSVYVMTFSNGYATRVLQFPFFLILIAISVSLARLSNGVSDDMPGVTVIPMILLAFFVCVELATGYIQAGQSGTYFDRTMIYHYTRESASLIEGSGAVR